MALVGGVSASDLGNKADRGRPSTCCTVVYTRNIHNVCIYTDIYIYISYISYIFYTYIYIYICMIIYIM